MSDEKKFATPLEGNVQSCEKPVLFPPKGGTGFSLIWQLCIFPSGVANFFASLTVACSSRKEMAFACKEVYIYSRFIHHYNKNDCNNFKQDGNTILGKKGIFSSSFSG